MDAAASASAAVISVPSPSAAVPACTRPSPIAASATWASGARSPEHPREPYSRTIGVMPAFSIAA